MSFLIEMDLNGLKDDLAPFLYCNFVLWIQCFCCRFLMLNGSQRERNNPEGIGQYHGGYSTLK
jgi:hypothetical protein